MKNRLRKAIISAVVVAAGLGILMPTASVFAAPAAVQVAPVQTQTQQPQQTPAPTPAPTPATTPTNTTTTTPATTPTSTNSSSTSNTIPATTAKCEGGALGWILCPVIKTSQEFVGLMEKWIIDQLDMGPLGTTGRYANLYKAWGGFRNLANVFFIGIFMAIIFAQTLSLGLDNYSIKMLLPRLVIAAVAIQLSYFIMQIGVDLSNIAGAGVAGIFNTVIASSGATAGGTSAGMTSATAWGALTVVGVAGGLAAGVTIVAGLVVPMLLLIVAAGLSLLGVIITVWMRVLVLQILVLLAPLAIVAWVLPNTESWYKRWSSNVIRLLLMYPMIMFLICAGALATQVSGITAESGTFAKMLGAMIPILIFFMIPATIKASGSIMNMTGNFIMGHMNGYSKAVRKSGLMQNAKQDLKDRSALQITDNDKNLDRLTTKPKKAVAMLRRGTGRVASGNALSFGTVGKRNIYKSTEHARHQLEEDWKSFFRENAFGNPELLKIAQQGLVEHNTGTYEVPNSYGKKYKLNMNHHLAEAAVSQMVQQQGMVELSELLDGKKNADGTMRDNSQGLFDHTTNQWRDKETQITMLRAIGSNAGPVLNKITHAIHLQGDRAYGELSGGNVAALGAGSGITASQEALKWNRVNSLNAMLTVVGTSSLAGSIQNDVAKSFKREILKAEAEGKFQGVEIKAQGQSWGVRDFFNTFITSEGQVTAIQGDIKRYGLEPIIDQVKLEQERLADEIKRARETQIEHPGGGH